MSGSRGGFSSSSASTVTSGRGGSEGSWWRWTQGRSGSVASSSDRATNGAGNAAKPSPNAWEAMRWQTRTTRGPAQNVKDASASSNAASSNASSPRLFSSSSQLRTTSRTSGASRKRAGQSPMRVVHDSTRSSKSSVSAAPSRTARPTAMSSRDVPDYQSRLDSSAAKWSSGSSKRKITRKDKRVTRSPSPHFLGVVSEGSCRTRDVRTQRTNSAESLVSADDVVMVEATHAERSSPVFASPTTVSNAAAFSLGFGNPDPLVTCARAVLQDCYRQRYLDSSNARKRTLEGCSKSNGKEAKHAGLSSKYSEFGALSGCSSSSDDELAQLSSFELAQYGEDKADCKASHEELYRQLMLCDYSLSTSPDFECFSPLFEEKGLPVEIRYQLPLALGTANETNKECTICQLRYGIGDHIVTLPCQHFFHACCVDKWLWNHTSCPLCRTEVSLEPSVEKTTTVKHRFNECPKLDQETMRRKMRSSSHSVGFRPVVPAEVEMDQLDKRLTTLAIEEEGEPETSSLTYLVCPKPQRPQPK